MAFRFLGDEKQRHTAPKQKQSPLPHTPTPPNAPFISHDRITYIFFFFVSRARIFDFRSFGRCRKAEFSVQGYLVWAEARCSYHVTFHGSESLWECGDHKHLDKRGAQTRIKEERVEEEGVEGRGGGEEDYTKNSPKKQKRLPHSPLLRKTPMCACVCVCVGVCVCVCERVCVWEKRTMDTLAKVSHAGRHWWHLRGLDASVLFISRAKHFFNKKYKYIKVEHLDLVWSF